MSVSNFRLTATHNSITGTWNTNPQAVAYAVRYRRAGDAAWMQIPGLVTVATSYTVEGLTQHTEYEMAVGSIVSGETIFTTATVTTPGHPNSPGVPTSVTLSATNNSVTIFWSPPTDGGTPTQYRIQFMDDRGWFFGGSPDATATEHTISAGTDIEYTLRIRAENIDGWSPWVTLSIRTFTYEGYAPGMPGYSIDVTHNTFTLTMTPSEPGGTPTSYEAQYRVQGTTTWQDVADTSSPIVIPDLSPMTAYDYRVRAVNSGGHSAWNVGGGSTHSDPALDAPGVPTSVSATATHNSITVTWSAPTTGGIPTGYDVGQRFTSPNPIHGWNHFENVTSPYVISDGISHSQNYQVRVRATSSGGSSDWVIVDISTPLIPNAPDAPTSVSATATSNSITLTWSEPTTGGDVDEYEVQYKLESETEWTDAADITSPSIIGSLAADTAYNVRVRATNDGGDSDWSTVNISTLPNAPGTPTSVSATATNDSITLVWSDPTDGGTVTGYEVQYKLDSETDWTDATDVTSPSVIDNLMAETAYDVRVRATNDSGNSDYVTVDVSTNPNAPGAPTSVSASATSNSITLTWSDPTTGGTVTGYEVQYKLGSETVWKDATDVTSPSVIYDLMVNTEYDVRVRATNETDNSSWVSVSVTTNLDAPGIPTSVSATAVDEDGISVSWSAPTSGGTPSSYSVRWRETGEAAWSPTNVITGIIGTSRTITMLEPETGYDLQVQAVNDGGASAWSPATPTTATTDAAEVDPEAAMRPTPSAPRRLAASAQEAGVVLTWLAPITSGTGGSINGYNIWRWHAETDWVEVIENTGSTDTTYTDTASLDDDEWYWYNIRALNAAGSGEWSGNRSVLKGASRPSPPRQLVADSQSSGVLLEWLEPASSGSGGSVTGYNIWRWHADSKWVEIREDTGTDATNYTDGATLLDGNWYWYNVRAINDSGEGEWSGAVSVIVNPTQPSAPRQLVADAQSTGVLLDWLEPTDSGSGGPVTGYNIWRWHAASGWVEIREDTGTTATNYIDDLAQLIEGDWYWYNVRAINAIGEGEWTNNASALINPSRPAPPRRLAADARSNGVVLDWLAPVESGTGGEITGYNIWRWHADSGWTEIRENTGTTATHFLDVAPLTDGEWYWYTVRALNIKGPGDWATPASALINPSLPSAPRRLTLTESNTAIRLQWLVPVDSGTGGAINEYEIWRQSGSGDWVNIATVSAILTAYEDLTDGLAPGWHTYAVRAVNAAGPGEWSETSSVTTATDVPQPPTSLTAMVGDDGITLNWLAPLHTGGEIITGYRVWRGDGSMWLQLTSDAGVSDLTYLDTDTLGDGIYFYRVQAITNNGAGDYSSVVQVIIGQEDADPTPSPPRALAADAQSTGVVLTWQAPATEGSGGEITGYEIHRSDGGEFTKVHDHDTTTTWTDTETLTIGATYFYALRAVNDAGAGEWSGSVAVIINSDVPSAPQRLTAVETMDGVLLAWMAPLDNGTGGDITGYEVWRYNGGEWSQIADLDNVLTYSDTDELSGSWYWWSVRAVNAAGPGEWSEASSITVARGDLAGPPGSLTAVATTTGVLLEWTAPLNDGGSPIIGYRIWRYNGVEWMEIVTDSGGDYDELSVNLSTTRGTLSSVTRNGRSWSTTLTAPAATGTTQAMTVTATVTDSDGATGIATRTWTVDSDSGGGPTITFTTEADVVEGESVTTIAGTVSDVEDDDDSLSVTLSTYLGTLSPVTRKDNTWSATLTALATTDATQAMTVTATVTDSDGATGIATRTWTVESNSGNDPVILFATDASSVAGSSAITITGTLSNTESTSTTYTDNMVAELGVGTYWYRVQAITEAGVGDYSAAAPVTLTEELIAAILEAITSAGGRPVVVTIGTIVYVGSPAAHTVEEETRGVGPYTYEMDNPPPGMAFNPSDRSLTGIPTTMFTPFRVYYNAIDSNGDVFPRCFEFYIEDTPIVVSIDGTSIIEGGLHAEPESYSTQHHGGPDVATIKVVGSAEALASCFNWMKRPIEIHGKEGGILWWGYVHRVQRMTGAIQTSANLNQYYTSIAMTHIHEFRPHEIDVNLTAWRQQKPYNQQYGDIELLVNDEAAGLRPIPTESELDGIIRPFRETSTSIEDSRRAPAGVVLNCVGWHRTLEHQHVPRYPRGVFGGTRNTEDNVQAGGRGANPRAFWVDYPTNEWAWTGKPYLTGIRFSHRHDAPGLGSKTITAEVRIAKRAAERPGVPPGYTTYRASGNPDTSDPPEEWLSEWKEIKLTSNPGYGNRPRWETYEIDFSGENIRLPADGFYFVIRNISGPGLRLSVTTDEARGLVSRHVFDRAQYIWHQDGGWQIEQQGQKLGCDVFLGGDIETVMDVCLDRHTAIRATAPQIGLNRQAPQASFALYREGTDLISSLLQSATRQTDLRYHITPDRKMVIENQPLPPAQVGVRRSIFDDDITRNTPGVILVASIPQIDTDRRWRFVGDGPLDAVTSPINSPYVSGGPAYLQLFEEEDGGLELFLSNVPFSRHGHDLGPRFTTSAYNLAIAVRLGDGTTMGWRLGSLLPHNTQPSNSYYHFPGANLAGAGTSHATLLAADVVNNTKQIAIVDVTHPNIDWSNREIVSDLYPEQDGREDKVFVMNQDGTWQTAVARGRMDFVGEWVEHDGTQSYCTGANYECRTGIYDISYRGENSAYEESRDTIGVNVRDPRQGPGGA